MCTSSCFCSSLQNSYLTPLTLISILLPLFFSEDTFPSTFPFIDVFEVQFIAVFDKGEVFP